MRPLLIVENKRLFATRSQQKTSSGNLRISAQWSRPAGNHRLQSGNKGCGPPMRLPRVRESFRVHVLVENA